MNENQSPRLELDADERRVLGVLIEKSLTTPQYYPMTINGIVTGCNQKSNRDPIVEFVDDEVEEILERLKGRGLCTLVYPAGGRSEKWRQELTHKLELPGQEMAVIGELLLRGPQSVGELRARASRMKKIGDQDELQSILDGLMARPQPLVVRLTPQGVKRGMRVTHGLYPAPELAEIQEAEDTGGTATAAPRRASSPGLAEDVLALRKRIETIEAHLGITPE